MINSEIIPGRKQMVGRCSLETVTVANILIGRVKTVSRAGVS